MSNTLTKNLNFFDINCMLGPTNTNREPSFRSAPELLSEMDRLGIEDALVYSSLSRFAHPADGNARLMEEICDEPRLHPCWVGMPPGTNELPEPETFVAQMLAQNVRALRLLPTAHRYPLLEETLRPLLRALNGARIPLLIDTDRAGWSEIKLDWREIFEIARRYPDLPLVLVREGGATARALYSVWEQYSNIYLDASYIQESRVIDEIATRFGPDKLLFGSGFPRFDAGGPLASILGASVDVETKSAIAGNNARCLLSLPKKSAGETSPWPCGKNGFRVFDVHGHLGRWDLKYYSDYTAAQMIERMDQLGIERFAVSDILAIGPDFRAGNNRIGQAVADFPERIAGYAVYNPNYESEMKDEMARCFDELGCSGIKLHCALHQTNTTDKSYRLAFQTAHEQQCPMLCHTEGETSPQFFRSILQEYSGCQFIYAHIGGGDKAGLEPLIEVAQECPNLFFDLGVSNIPRGVLTWLVQNAPVEQILYGSDHPLNGFAFQLGRVLFADISDADKRKILWDNAARIFKVD